MPGAGVVDERLLRIPVPAGVERLEGDRVARVDREHGLEVAREVPVQGPALEGQLVEH